MLIRSQNKVSLININAIDTISVEEYNNSFNIVTYNGGLGSRTYIGEYSTREKAIKVLDMIQNEYMYANQYGYINSCVFQMPQDEEVIMGES